MKSNQLVQAESALNRKGLRGRGLACYRQSPAYRDLATVMNHPEFSAFVEKYLMDARTLAPVLMMMRTHQELAKQFPDHEPHEILGLLDKCMLSGEVRARAALSTSTLLGQADRLLAQ